MTAVIGYYCAPNSGFAYLGEPRLRPLSAGAGAEIQYRPLDIGWVLAASEAIPPFKQSAARQTYRQEEMSRWAARFEAPVRPTLAYIMNGAGLCGLDRLGPYTEALQGRRADVSFTR